MDGMFQTLSGIVKFFTDVFKNLKKANQNHPNW
jgi:hypothetical protein